MKFILSLFGIKPRGGSDQTGDAEALEQSYRDTIGSIVEENQAASGLSGGGSDAEVSNIMTSLNAKRDADASPVNIWDMDDDASTPLPTTAPVLPQAADPAANAARSPSRARRTKTRLIGFDKSDGDVVDLFDEVPKAAPTVRAKFPVGWLVVSEGPGRGECFALSSGMSQIGRGEDQAVQLDFGDSAISRTNHAAIVYDPENREFLLGHGGKSNIVRLNDKPLISNEALKTGDVIKMGETLLRFVALCDETFSWADTGSAGEDEDVAIA